MSVAGLFKRTAVEGVHRLFLVPPLEAALTRFTQGREIFDLVGKLAPANGAYRHPAYRTVTRDGINFKLDISDYQDWLVYWGFCTDRPQALYALIRPGTVVFDVGANLGDVALNLAAMVGPEGKVHAFEPDPVSFTKLTENLALNAFTNVTTWKLGLGEVPGALTMNVNSPGNRGGNRIASTRPTPESFAIEIDTIDGLVERQDISRIDLIKIDVEGFELSVLKGARKTLQRLRPKLFVELADRHLQEHGSTSAELIAFLRREGYRVSHAVTGLELNESSRLEPHFDAVCLPAEPATTS
jgi:FkbM family methyltransferase